MRDIDANAVTNAALMSRISEVFEIAELVPEFSEPLAILSEPVPFETALERLGHLDMEVAGMAVLRGEVGEPQGAFHTLFAQGDVPLRDRDDVAA